jgi:hypothetical protein
MEGFSFMVGQGIIEMLIFKFSVLTCTTILKVFRVLSRTKPYLAFTFVEIASL